MVQRAYATIIAALYLGVRGRKPKRRRVLVHDRVYINTVSLRERQIPTVGKGTLSSVTDDHTCFYFIFVLYLIV